MNRLLHKLLYRILPLGGYLQTVSAMFFLSHRLGIGRHAPATEYTFHLDRLMRAGDLTIDIGANLGYYARLMSRIAGRNGDSGNFSSDLPAVRYIRIRCLKNWSGNTNMTFTEISFWGDDKVQQ